MTETKISIIIPVYNLEKYIIHCLESIEKQVYRNYEVIIVNDGSTDESENLIRSFIEKHALNNYFLISKENAGIAAARNIGLKQASGYWCTFIDGDDWIEPDYFSFVYNDYGSHEPDLVAVGYQAYDMVTKKRHTRSNYTKREGYLPEDMDTFPSFSYVWAHFYKKSIIDKYQIRFDERLEYCEDSAFNFDYNCKIHSFAFDEKVRYTYRINREGAATNKRIHPKIKYYLYEHMINFCKDKEEYVVNALERNKKLSWAVWNCISTGVTNDILDNKYADAKEKMNTPLSQKLISIYLPRTKKEKIFLCLWKRSFLSFAFIIKLYYKNFNYFRNSKFVVWLSKNNARKQET